MGMVVGMNSPKELWENTKSLNICGTRVPEGEEKEHSTGK